nr:T9SS type A sorting domain-containing protein [Chitinophagaceae bacterium]
KQLALKLYNTIGELVISKEINNENSTSVIDLSEVPKGLYLYELIDKLEVVSRAKLILE